MSESQDQDEPQVGIDDDLLPEDLQPSEDNPLAEGLDDGETVDDLLSGGKNAEQLDDEPSDESDV
ncbi:MAG: hypothetical protein WC642_03185 [Nocardioides sp.]|jgi:hypothetical protein